MKKIIFSAMLLTFLYSMAFSTVTCGVTGVDWSAAVINSPFAIRHEQGCLIFNNRMWVIGGGGPVWPNEKDVWSSADGANWTLATANAAFGPRGAGGYLVYDNGTGPKMWVIGGEHDGEWQKDVWCSSNGADWQLATGNAAFGTRECMAAYVYNNKMWIAGGYDGTDRNDVWWSSNGADWYQATSSAPWGPRSYPAFAVYDNGTGSKMWIIGGGAWGGGTGSGDAWSSSDGVNWTQATNSFQPRFQARAEVFDGKLWVIGGTANAVKLNDVWYTTDGAAWAQATASAAFPERCDGATFVYDNRMWYVAGIQYDAIQFNDVWYTCGSSIQTPVPTPTATPACAAIGANWISVTNNAAFGNRSLHTTLSYNGYLWTMFGSNNSYPHIPSVYKSSDAATWDLVAQDTAIGQRAYQSGIVFNNLMYIVAGNSNGTYKNDVWHSSNGVTWTADTLNAAFPARDAFGLLEFNNKLWVFGGSNGTPVYLKDVWYSPDGASWTQATSNAAFGGRCCFQPVVFDNGTGPKMWIFGGVTSAGNSAGIWNSSDGINWNLVTSSAAFGPRSQSVCTVYDGKIWVIGGGSPSGIKQDAWYSLDGINWTLSTANTGMANPAGAAAAEKNTVLYITGGNYDKTVFKTGCFAVTPVATSLPTAVPTPTPNNTNNVCVQSDTTWQWLNPDSGNVEFVPVSGTYVNYPPNAVPGITEPIWPRPALSYGMDASEMVVYKTFTLPDNYAAQAYQASILILADDMGRVEVNGTIVGGCIMGNSTLLSQYTALGCQPVSIVPASLSVSDPAGSIFHKGQNTLKVHVRGTDCCASWLALSMCVSISNAVTPQPTPAATDTPTPAATSIPTPRPEPTVHNGDSTCYPTKAKDHLKIVFNTDRKADCRIYVYDISGKLMKTIDVKTGTTPNEKLYKVNLDVRGFPPGVYYYVIQGKAEHGELINFKSKKFIVKGSK